MHLCEQGVRKSGHSSSQICEVEFTVATEVNVEAGPLYFYEQTNTFHYIYRTSKSYHLLAYILHAIIQAQFT